MRAATSNTRERYRRHRDDDTTFTKPTAGARRNRNRAKVRAAKLARKANR